MAKKEKTLSIVAVRHAVHLGDGRIVRSDPVDVDEDQAKEAIDAGVCRLAPPPDGYVGDDDSSGPDVAAAV